MKLIIIKLKNIIIPLSICIFTFWLVLYSSNNLIAAKNGMILWAFSIVPSMFPFFIATELLSYTNIIHFLGKVLNKMMRPVFNVPGAGSFALVMGIISGYPIGAKIVSNLKSQGLCTDIECERLLSFTNNSGPLFIIGTVGITMFSSQAVGLKLFAVHILSCLVVGFLFRWWKNSSRANLTSAQNSKSTATISFYNLSEILSLSIQSAIKSILIIGGFVILFSVIVSMLSSSKLLIIFTGFINPFLYIFNIPFSYSNGIIVGIIEVTNGLKSVAIPNNNISIILCSFLLGLGGICVFLQVFSIASKAKISIKPYIIGKFLQACFSALLMYLLLNNF